MDSHQQNYALNHATVPSLSWCELANLGSALGCVGVEFRTDLEQPLFGDDDPRTVGSYCDDLGLQILALAEVRDFNDVTPEVLNSVLHLAQLANRAHAKAIVLIPRMDGEPATLDEILHALDKIRPILNGEGIKGLIEPIGFERSSIRDFDLVRKAILEIHGAADFGIVHDTFHHHLLGSGAVSDEMVEIVHASGVGSEATAATMSDADRVLVDKSDRLGTVRQIRKLTRGKKDIPISLEAFAPEVQACADPYLDLKRSLEFITMSMGESNLPRQGDDATAPLGVPA